jgi:hypothetical protein
MRFDDDACVETNFVHLSFRNALGKRSAMEIYGLNSKRYQVTAIRLCNNIQIFGFNLKILKTPANGGWRVTESVIAKAAGCESIFRDLAVFYRPTLRNFFLLPSEYFI